MVWPSTSSPKGDSSIEVNLCPGGIGFHGRAPNCESVREPAVVALTPPPQTGHRWALFGKLDVFFGEFFEWTKDARVENLDDLPGIETHL